MPFDEVGCVEQAPAGLGGLYEFEEHRKGGVALGVVITSGADLPVT
jgi:hypothetical protein